MNPASSSSSAPNAADYGFHCEIEGRDFGAAVDGRPYIILGACNPPLAHRALVATTTMPNRG